MINFFRAKRAVPLERYNAAASKRTKHSDMESGSESNHSSTAASDTYSENSSGSDSDDNTSSSPIKSKLIITNLRRIIRNLKLKIERLEFKLETGASTTKNPLSSFPETMDIPRYKNGKPIIPQRQQPFAGRVPVQRSTLRTGLGASRAPRYNNDIFQAQRQMQDQRNTFFNTESPSFLSSLSNSLATKVPNALVQGGINAASQAAQNYYNQPTMTQTFGQMAPNLMTAAAQGFSGNLPGAAQSLGNAASTASTALNNYLNPGIIQQGQNMFTS